MSENIVSNESKKRKNPVACQRRATNALYDTSCVVMKWKSLCKNEHLRDGIHDVVCVWTKLAFEAYQFLNFHFLRLIHADLELPQVDQTLMLRCCNAVSLNYETQAIVDRQLEESKQLWIRERLTNNVSAIDTSHLAHFINQLPVEMLTACKNHIVLNFTKRLLRWMKRRLFLDHSKSWKLLYDTFDLVELSLDPANHVTLTYEQQGLAEMLIHFPSENNIKNNFIHFVNLSYILARDMEDSLSRAVTNKERKGIRTFNLFPLKTSLIPSHIPLNPTTLPVIINYLVRKHGGFSEIFPADNQRKCSASLISSFVNELWPQLFDFKKHETANRKFAFCITTNGYSASLHLKRPKPPDLEVEELEPASKRIHLSSDMYVRKVACDPGAINLFYGQDQDGNYVKATTKEYRHMSKMNHQRKWNENLKKRFPEYKTVIEGIPSLALTNPYQFLHAAFTVLVNRDFLYDFCSTHAFLKWKFKTRVFSAKALVSLCKRVCGKVEATQKVEGKKEMEKSKVVVGIGDWSRRDGIIKRHPSGPVKKWQKVLKNFATVVEIDEHGTSINCSACQKGRCYGITNQYFNKEGDEVSHKSHKILRCNNNECEIFWHRDKNSANNHYLILRTMLNNQERPKHLQRHGRALNNEQSRNNWNVENGQAILPRDEGEERMG